MRYGRHIRLSLIHLMVWDILCFTGFVAGVLFFSLFHLHTLVKLYLALVCGIMSVFLFSWPIYKWIDLLPPFPKCPQCDLREYIGIEDDETQEVALLCGFCNRIVMLFSTENDTIETIDDVGDIKRKFKLLPPKILGIWKECNIL